VLFWGGDEAQGQMLLLVGILMLYFCLHSSFYTTKSLVFVEHCSFLSLTSVWACRRRMKIDIEEVDRPTNAEEQL
jgi:hypothetical protein